MNVCNIIFIFIMQCSFCLFGQSNLTIDTLFYKKGEIKDIWYYDSIKDLDTLYYLEDRVKEISHLRNGLPHGLTITYFATKELISEIQSYINGKKHGFQIFYDYHGKIFNKSCYFLDTLIYSESYYNGVLESKYSTNMIQIPYITYDTLGILSGCYFRDGVSIEYYPNAGIKSTTLNIEGSKDSAFVYYEFYESGGLKVEGTFSDSFIFELDTFITKINIREELFQVIQKDICIKNKNWYYFSTKGILEKRQLFTWGKKEDEK